MSLVTKVGGLSTVLPSGDLPIPDMWLDATAISGLSDNDLVATWTDKSENGNNATQSTTANKPRYKTNQINGLPMVDFSADNVRYMGIPVNLARNKAGVTVLVVYRALAIPDPGNKRLFYLSRGTDGSHRITIQYNDAAMAFLGRRLDADSVVSVSSSDQSNDTNYQITGVWDFAGGYLYGYEGGASMGSPVAFSSGAGNSSDTDSTYALLGNYYTHTSGFGGGIGELLYYKHKLTANEIATAEGYLARKWGIS